MILQRKMSENTDIAIKVDSLNKVYRLYEQPIDRLKELLFRKSKHTDFVALQNISFCLSKGKTLGVIGDNGAGKSTLLQLIAGTLTPSSGEIHIEGNVLGLLELGLGFHIEFTGLQNIFLYGDVLGLSRRFVESKLDEIIAFSELGPFIDRPLKTYSTGMKMRLAFSLVSSLDPEILIIDEALSVGDMHFQKKCIDRMTNLKSQGRTIIFCSHSVYQVGMFCDEVLWLKDRTIYMRGEAAKILPAYEAYQMRKDQSDNTHQTASVNKPAVISELAVTNDLPLERNSDLKVYIVVESISEELPYHVSVSIKMDDGRGIYVTGTHLLGRPPLYGRRREIIITYPDIPLMGGFYSVHARIFDDEGLMVYHEKILPDLEVFKDSKELGVCRLNNNWQVI